MCYKLKITTADDDRSGTQSYHYRSTIFVKRNTSYNTSKMNITNMSNMGLKRKSQIGNNTSSQNYNIPSDVKKIVNQKSENSKKPNLKLNLPLKASKSALKSKTQKSTKRKKRIAKKINKSTGRKHQTKLDNNNEDNFVQEDIGVFQKGVRFNINHHKKKKKREEIKNESHMVIIENEEEIPDSDVRLKKSKFSSFKPARANKRHLEDLLESIPSDYDIDFVQGKIVDFGINSNLQLSSIQDEFEIKHGSTNKKQNKK